MTVSASIIEVQNLKKWFPVRTGIRSFFAEQKWVKAVDGVSFDVKPGGSLVIAGESGSGKTTLVRTMLRLIEPTAGSVNFEGKAVFKMLPDDLRLFRRSVQLIFQNPFEVLDPRLTIKDLVAEGLIIHKIVDDEDELMKRVLDTLEDVRLIPAEDFARRFPHELSGGQLQRVAIARSLILEPKLVIADEPVSMLDASIRTEIMNLMADLQKAHGLTYVFITHDLAQARYIGDWIIIMYLGKAMEMGPMEDVLQDPIHPYTRALISHIPIPDPTMDRDRINIPGETPTPIDLPPGCRFRPRCQDVDEFCTEDEPELKQIGPKRWVACHGWEARKEKKHKLPYSSDK
jgi:peptide/nickel transport system ATP-binding protein